MYNIEIKKENSNCISLLDDLYYLFIEKGFNIDKYNYIDNADILKNKELCVNKGNLYLSMNANKYRLTNSSDETENILLEPVLTETYQETGSFGVSVNKNYNSNKNFGHQETNSINSVFYYYPVSCCSIPKEDVFDYTIYSDKNGFNFIVKIEFQNMSFFSFFGSASKCGELFDGGGYCFSNNFTDEEDISIGYSLNDNNDIYEDSNSNLKYNFNFMNQEDFKAKLNIFFYNSDNELENYRYYRTSNISTNLISKDSEEDRSGFTCFNSQLSKSLSNVYTQSSILVNFEIYCAEDNNLDNKKLFKKFNFGFCSPKIFKDGTIHKINNKYYEITKIFKDNQGISSKNIANNGLMMFIERGDINE